MPALASGIGESGQNRLGIGPTVVGSGHAARARKIGGDPVMRYSSRRSVIEIRVPPSTGSISMVTCDGSPSTSRDPYPHPLLGEIAVDDLLPHLRGVDRQVQAPFDLG